MLSGETAQGKYPVESLKMMVKIAMETEKTSGAVFLRSWDDERQRKQIWDSNNEARWRFLGAVCGGGAFLAWQRHQQPGDGRDHCTGLF